VQNSTLKHARTTESQLHNSVANNSNFTASIIDTNSRIYNSNLTSSNTTNSQINDSIIKDSNLTNSIIDTNSQVYNSNLANSNSTNSQINNTKLLRTDTTNSTIFDNSIQINDSTIRNSNITNVTFDNTIIDYSTINSSTMLDSSSYNSQIKLDSKLLNSASNNSLIESSTLINVTAINCTIINSTKTNVVLIGSIFVNNQEGNSTTTGSNVSGSNIINSVVTYSLVQDSNITTSNINISTIINSRLENLTATNVTIINSTRTNMIIAGSTIINSQEYDSVTTGSQISSTSLQFMTFLYSTAKDSNLAFSYIDRSNITGSTIDYNSTILYSNVTNSTIIHSTVNYSDITNCNINNSLVNNAKLANATLVGAEITNSNFLTGNLVLVNSEMFQNQYYGTISAYQSKVNYSTLEESSVSTSTINGTVLNHSSTSSSQIFSTNITSTPVSNSVIRNSVIQDTGYVTLDITGIKDLIIDNAFIWDGNIYTGTITYKGFSYYVPNTLKRIYEECGDGICAGVNNLQNCPEDCIPRPPGAAPPPPPPPPPPPQPPPQEAAEAPAAEAQATVQVSPTTRVPAGGLVERGKEIANRLLELFGKKEKPKLETNPIPCVRVTKSETKQVLIQLQKSSLEQGITLPAQSELTTEPFYLICSEEASLEITLSIPEDFIDLQALECTNGNCVLLESETVDNLECGESITQQFFGITETQEKRLLLNFTWKDNKTLSADRTIITFDNIIKDTNKISAGTPTTKETPLKGTNNKIVGIPIYIKSELNQSLPATITIPYTSTIDIEEATLALYALVDEGNNTRWENLDGKKDKENKKITTHVADITKFLGKENKAYFALIADRCISCTNTTFEKVYNPSVESKEAVIMIHGLLSSPSTFQYIVDDIRLTQQPWQAWVFGYPSERQISTNAIDFANHIEAHTNEYEHVYIAAHSMGGLVTQEALRYAYDENNKTPGKYTFVNKVEKVVLVGTPNQGSPGAEVYTNVLGYVGSVGTNIRTFSMDYPSIQELIKGKEVERVPGIDYYVIAGTRSFDTGADLIDVSGKLFGNETNDGIVGVKSAQKVGNEYVNNSCSNYWAINETHTQLLDNPSSRKIIERIVATEILKDYDPTGILGHTKYLKIRIPQCKPGTQYVIAGKKVFLENTAQPAGCSCGNGYCGEGEDQYNCPSDCANIFREENIRLALPYVIEFLSILLFLVLTACIYKVYRYRQMSKWFYVMFSLSALIVIAYVRMNRYIQQYTLLGLTHFTIVVALMLGSLFYILYFKVKSFRYLIKYGIEGIERRTEELEYEEEHKLKKFYLFTKKIIISIIKIITAAIKFLSKPKEYAKKTKESAKRLVQDLRTVKLSHITKPVILSIKSTILVIIRELQEFKDNIKSILQSKKEKLEEKEKEKLAKEKTGFEEEIKQIEAHIRLLEKIRRLRVKGIKELEKREKELKQKKKESLNAEQEITRRIEKLEEEQRKDITELDRRKQVINSRKKQLETLEHNIKEDMLILKKKLLHSLGLYKAPSEIEKQRHEELKETITQYTENLEQVKKEQQKIEEQEENKKKIKPIIKILQFLRLKKSQEQLKQKQQEKRNRKLESFKKAREARQNHIRELIEHERQLKEKKQQHEQKEKQVHSKLLEILGLYRQRIEEEEQGKEKKTKITNKTETEKQETQAENELLEHLDHEKRRKKFIRKRESIIKKIEKQLLYEFKTVLESTLELFKKRKILHPKKEEELRRKLIVLEQNLSTLKQKIKDDKIIDGEEENNKNRLASLSQELSGIKEKVHKEELKNKLAKLNSELQEIDQKLDRAQKSRKEVPK